MAKKPTLTDLTSNYGAQSTINNNNTAIEAAFENTLSLDGSTPNSMGADFDLNGNDLLNGGTVNTNILYVAGVRTTSTSSTPSWKGVWLTATAYLLDDIVREAGSTYICVEAHTSGTFSTDLGTAKWELFAQQGAAGAGTGDILAANNLSDLANAATSRTNLGLGTLATQASTAVNIEGGNIDGTVIGAATPAAATVTTLTATAGGLSGVAITSRVGSLSGTTPALSAATYDVVTWTLTAVSTPTDSLASGQSLLMLIDDGTSYTINWPTIKWVNNASVEPTLASTGYTHIYLYKVGSVLYGLLVGESTP